MTDLFANLPTGVPARGSLSPSAERGLYQRDVQAWREYAGQNLARVLLAEEPRDVIGTWGRLSDDYKRVLWAIWTEAEREHIRAVLATRPAAGAVPA